MTWEAKLPPSKKKDYCVSIRVPLVIKKWLERQAASYGINVTDVVLAILSDAYEKQPGKKL